MSNGIKAKKAYEVKKGDMVRVMGLEMWVDSVRQVSGRITLWGSWVVAIDAEEVVQVVKENWGE